LDEFSEENNTDKLNYNKGNFGLRHNLIKRTEEGNDRNEELLGYDFIGLECDGSFHSFYCHDITKELIDKFSLTLNANGLFDRPERPVEITEYLNAPEAGVEPVPWYIVKVKRQKNAGS